MTTVHDRSAWDLATALGLALDPPLDCARWAAGLTTLKCTCGEWGDGQRLIHTSCPDHGADLPAHGRRAFRDGPPREKAVPVSAPWDADAYRADAARRGVEPAPLPSLRYVPATGLWWQVNSGASVTIGHGEQTLWDVRRGQEVLLHPRFRAVPMGIAADGFWLAEVAAEAMQADAPAWVMTPTLDPSSPEAIAIQSKWHGSGQYLAMVAAAAEGGTTR